VRPGRGEAVGPHAERSGTRSHRGIVTKAHLLGKALRIVLSSFVGLVAACNSDDVKIADVPRKDIPKEAHNKPIPPNAFKYMRSSGPRTKHVANLSATK
jgi:hypothetical protein